MVECCEWSLLWRSHNNRPSSIQKRFPSSTTTESLYSPASLSSRLQELSKIILGTLPKELFSPAPLEKTRLDLADIKTSPLCVPSPFQSTSSMYSTARPSNFRSFLPSPAQSTCSQKILLPPPQPSSTHIQKPNRSRRADEAAFPRSGLRTPPADNTTMGTTYQTPNLATYDNHLAHHSAFNSALSTSDRTRPTVSESVIHPYPRYSSQGPPQQPPQQPPSSLSRTTAASASSYPSTSHTTSNSRQSTRPSTPTSNPTSGTRTERAISTTDASLTMHSLQIPPCIAPDGGSLDEFAAQVSFRRHF